MPPIEPNDEERQQQLPQDGQTPFAPADPQLDDSVADEELVVTNKVDPTHPATDTEMDLTEAYQDGIGEAAGISEPNANNQVDDYNPEIQNPPQSLS